MGALPPPLRLFEAGQRVSEGRATPADLWLAGFALTALAGADALLARRDDAIRELAALYPDDLPLAARIDAVAIELRRYSEKWRRIDHLSWSPPAAHAGTPLECLFAAYRFGGGEVPQSAKQLRRILLTR